MKRLLENNFTLKLNYIIHKYTPPNCGDVDNLIHKNEKILMTIDTFKKLCLKANTKKADEIHNYYVKLEKMFLQTMNEQTQELRLELQQKVQEIKNQEIHYNINLNTNKHKLLLEKFNFKKCIYLGQIIINGIIYIKLGSTEDIYSRY